MALIENDPNRRSAPPASVNQVDRVHELSRDEELGTLRKQTLTLLTEITIVVKGELPVVGCRVPHPLNEKLQALCDETGNSRSKILQDALSAYLGVHSPDSIESLNKRVAALERQYKKLAQLV